MEMKHNEAQQQEAVERYLLNEMSDAEAEMFEAHFFDCAICAEEVRAGTRMMAAGQVVARQESKGGADVVPFPFFKYLATAATMVFALLSGNAYLRVIPQLQHQVAVATRPSMDVVVPPEPLQIAARGEKEIPLAAGKPVSLPLVVPPDLDKKIVRYDFEVRKVDGTFRLKDTASPTPDQSNLNVLLGSLPAGSYVLTIRGVAEGNRTENVTTYFLKVQ
jgi:hypothetical protein